MYRFPWYLTLVSTNHASSNPGQVDKVEVKVKVQVDKGLNSIKAKTIVTLLETFRFKDENDYEYEIWLQVFSRILKI